MIIVQMYIYMCIMLEEVEKAHDLHYELQLHCKPAMYFGTSPQNRSSSSLFMPHSSLNGLSDMFNTVLSISRSPFFSTRSISSSRIQFRGKNCFRSVSS
jgi:hypothetical protein